MLLIVGVFAIPVTHILFVTYINNQRLLHVFIDIYCDSLFYQLKFSSECADYDEMMGIWANRLPWLLLCLAALVVQTGCGSTAKNPDSSLRESPKASQVADMAKELVGTPYRYGGLNPKTGFDCSGLVYYTHRSVGRTLPRTSHEQFASTAPIKRTHLVPGDLVFFRIRRNRISHVGIYLGNDRFVHAPSSGKAVRINSLDEPYWDRRFIRGGRVF